MCGFEVGCQQRRMCRGPQQETARAETAEAEDLQGIVHRAETSSSESLLFSRGLVEHPLEDPFLDCTPAQEELNPDFENPPILSGRAYSDGSGKGPPGLKSFGWGYFFPR